MFQAVLVTLTAVTCIAQNFEVATIKPGAPPGMTGVHMGVSRGGPKSLDPGHFSCQNCTLLMLVTDAFNVRPSQVSGPPWMATERFDITAKIPRGSTEEQALIMEQNLLAERFKMAFHREPKEMPVYELIVGKGGPKFKEAAKDAAVKSNGEILPKDKEDLPAGYERTVHGYRMLMKSGQVKIHADGETMQELASSLWSVAGRPVVDRTGLTGEYEFTLSFAADIPGARAASAPPSGPPAASTPEGDAGPSLFTAVQEQLGLKLESTRGPVDTIVIDHLEKAPTGN